MIDNSLIETICCFYSCALFSNIYCKINFKVKNRSDLCNFCTKQDFGKKKDFIKKYVMLLLTD